MAADSYWLIAGNDGSANIYHYNVAGQKPGDPSAVYVGPTAAAAKLYGPQVARTRGLKLNSQILNEQGAPSDATILGAGLAFSGASLPRIVTSIADVILGGSRVIGSGAADTATAEPTVRPNPDEQPSPSDTAPSRGRTRPGGGKAPEVAAQNTDVGGEAAKRLAGEGLGLGSVLDFLNLITWLFHPANWLRAVEFLTGMLLIYWGFRSSFQSFRDASAAVGSTVRNVVKRVPV